MKPAKPWRATCWAGSWPTCGTDPITGFYRTGCCDTGAEDAGVHTVCARVTAEFLTFSAAVGNDLSTPRPEFGFAGLRPGDRWCLCAARWAEALAAGVAPPVVLEATHARTLEWVDLADLRTHRVPRMISVELAVRLQAAGLAWSPASGDRFVIADRDMDGDVFVVSELTIEVHQAPTGPLIRFNGTTEWALDSVEQEATVWLPREGQLRDALGPRFRRLEPVGAGFAVVIERAGVEERHVDVDAERAYARALLASYGTESQWQARRKQRPDGVADRRW